MASLTPGVSARLAEEGHGQSKSLFHFPKSASPHAFGGNVSPLAKTPKGWRRSSRSARERDSHSSHSRKGSSDFDWSHVQHVDYLFPSFLSIDRSIARATEPGKQI